jgi:TPR repeat protein
MAVGLALPTAAWAERRVALVVGNAAYAQPLKNPMRDAAKVAETLRNLDFEVLLETNLDKPGMERALRHFMGLLNGADVGLFYYSGHALQSEGRNYLLPVSASLQADLSLTLDAVALQDISALVKQTGVKTSLLFLDACRNNPFTEHASSTTRGAPVTRGLARVSSALGSLVVFSTSPGEVAYDGDGDLSPFTSAFARHALTPKLEIRQVITRVRADVARDTSQKQVPYDDSSLFGDFFLVPSRPPPLVDKVVTAIIPEGQPRAPLNLRAPVQPEGGPVTSLLTEPPREGSLMLGEKALARGDRIPAEDVPRLDYVSKSTAPDALGLLVEDSWGNQEPTFVSLVHGGATATAPAPAPVPNIGAVEFQGVSLVGLGPNFVLTAGPKPPADSGQVRVKLASALPFGQLLLGDRVIETGRVVTLSDVPSISFLAPPGQAGQRVTLDFAAVSPAIGQAKLTIDVQVTDCDRLAGSPLDPQGVAEGLFSNLIDVKKALPACEAAVRAKPQVARFHHELGRVLAASGRTADAVQVFEKAASMGYVRSRETLGFMYLVGAGVPADAEKGLTDLKKAASEGDVYALQSLGQAFYEGRALPLDFDKARTLFEQAARAGHTYAMNSLGRMYLRGEGVPADPATARRYWEAAAARGDVYGIHNLGYVYLDGIATEPAPDKALALFRKAADLGHPEAPNSIGRLYLNGIGVPQDAAQARTWYRIGADRGDGWAAVNLATLLQEGRGGPASADEAALYFARAISLKNLEAAEQGRKQLGLLSAKAKLGAIRALLGLMRAAPPQGATDAQILAVASRKVEGSQIRPADASLDATLTALARAQWLALGVRTDLF